jgi:hypothetical protein
MYDLSGVEALRPDLKIKAETAKIFRDAGLTLAQVNELLELGFQPKDLKEPEPVVAPAPQAESEPDEGTVREMAKLAVMARSRPELFGKAVASIHRKLNMNSHSIDANSFLQVYGHLSDDELVEVVMKNVVAH